MKIRHITITFSSPMLLVTLSSFSLNFRRGFCINATTRAIRKPTIAGMA